MGWAPPTAGPGAHPMSVTAQGGNAMARTPDPNAANFYTRLGVLPDASPSEINTAYRQLARALHPDSAQTGGGDPHALQLVVEAHRTLADANQRQHYDSISSPSRAPTCSPRSEQLTTCTVCRGTGAIARPCRQCAGTGHVLTNAPWLRTPVLCPACHARGLALAGCGACGATGRAPAGTHW
jgi:DnaJ-class molecular chaperone